MENSTRRNFLKVAGISALTLSTVPAAIQALAAGPAAEPGFLDNPEAVKGLKWGMVVDVSKLNPQVISAVQDACHKIHNVPHIDNEHHEIKWIWEEDFEHAFPTQVDNLSADKIKHAPFLVLCNHCENAPCVRACPTRATFKREDGIVVMDFHRCIGCRFCMAACPYGSRSFNFRDPRPFIEDEDINPLYPTRMKGVVEKCNFCAELLARGLQPACIEPSEGALIFGDLGDPESEIRKVLRENYSIRRKPSLGTGPNVYYIV